jgi:hypothetical protein
VSTRDEELAKAVRLAQEWRSRTDAGDAAGAAATKRRIRRWYIDNGLRGFWMDFASDWFEEGEPRPRHECRRAPSGSLFPQPGAAISNARCQSCGRELRYGRDGMWKHERGDK